MVCCVFPLIVFQSLVFKFKRLTTRKYMTQPVLRKRAGALASPQKRWLSDVTQHSNCTKSPPKVKRHYLTFLSFCVSHKNV